jgi:hypothetical protein
MSATEMPPHVSIVFKELFDEIKSTKRQQWTTTNYCLLILAVIYALTAQLPDYSLLLQILVVITALVGSGLLLRMQSHLARSRIRLDKIHKNYFTEDDLKRIGLTQEQINALDALGDETSWQQYLRYYRLGCGFLIILIAVLIVGAVLVFLQFSDIPDAESAAL